MMPLQPEPLFRKTTMSAQCTDHCHTPTASADPRYRRILWIALLVNAAMFVVELGAGTQSGSASLLADAIDFLGDAANYGVSLLLIRPCEVLSRVANVTILEVANNALRVLLQHRHVIIGSLA